MMTSRTISIAQAGLFALMVLAGVGLLALAMGVRAAELEAVCSVVGQLGACVAATTGAGGGGHAGRHWGAKEPSGTRSTNA